MDKDLNSEAELLLFESVLELKTVEECESFFKDLCTIQELKAMMQRILVAKLLKKKRIYSEVVKDTGASTATISRVSRALNYGDGGYNLVLDRIENKSL